jgi:hypothetical protein
MMGGMMGIYVEILPITDLDLVRAMVTQLRHMVRAFFLFPSFMPIVASRIALTNMQLIEDP